MSWVSTINHKIKRWLRCAFVYLLNSFLQTHAELDEATALDRGNPQELGREHKKLKEGLKQLNVFGGCCGTDEEHVLAIASQVKTA